MKLKLSIIIPFYNVEQYIAQCLDSVYNQDIPEEEYEVICVNDASPDNSREIVKEYQKNHKNLMLVEHEHNKKLGAARNTGIKAAQGMYVLFVDSDDKLRKNCLNNLLEIISENQCDYVLFNHSQMKEGMDGTPVYVENNSIFETGILSGSEMFCSSSCPWSEQIVAWNKIYRLEFLRKNNLYFAEDIMYEDNDFAFRASAAAKRCIGVKVSPYVYRINMDSETRKPVSIQSLKYWMETWKLINQIQEGLVMKDKRYDKVVDEYMVSSLSSFMSRFNTLAGYQRKLFKKENMKEWIRFTHFLPIHQRIAYLYKIMRA